MRRTPLLRKSGLSHTETAAKVCAYEKCKKQFYPHPARPLANVCSPRCTIRRAEAAVKARQAAEKAQKKQDREKRDSLKTITQREHECKDIVQKIARIRDRHDGCISCHMGPDYQGQWHGSHFRPAGNHAATELHLWNIHKSCAQCNKYKGGNIAGYRPKLIAKIGLERVEWLESQNQVTKRTVEYLKRFKAVMGKRLRRMEKRAAN